MFRSNRRWYFPSRFYSTVILVLRSIWIPMADVQEGVPMFRFSKLQSWIPMQLTRAFQVSLQLLFLLILSQKDKMTRRLMRQKLGQENRGPRGWRIGKRVELERWQKLQLPGESNSRGLKQRSKGIWLRCLCSSVSQTERSIYFPPQYIGQNWWLLSVEGTANASQIRQIVPPEGILE